ncbi:MAG: MBL fold metallo-hydrolase, partial [Nitrospinota bacterium]|nr:MBL fold metallo-hydrolase [Nitrospinota bacterium]
MANDPALALTVLGTGDAFATGGHPHSCYLLEPIGEGESECHAALIDCGPTAVPMLQGMAFDLAEIDLVLLTHHHGDHIAGVAFLYLNYQFLFQRNRPLTVAGPP